MAGTPAPVFCLSAFQFVEMALARRVDLARRPCSISRRMSIAPSSAGFGAVRLFKADAEFFEVAATRGSIQGHLGAG
jgi:hypothetical protein